jgi:hypothetical protein
MRPAAVDADTVVGKAHAPLILGHKIVNKLSASSTTLSAAISFRQHDPSVVTSLAAVGANAVCYSKQMRAHVQARQNLVRSRPNNVKVGSKGCEWFC